MIKVREETKAFFGTDKESLFAYLDLRNLQNQEYRKFIQESPFGCLEENTLLVDGEGYGVSHFLTVSNIDGFDLEKANKNLGLDKGEVMAIALVEGDDVLCLHLKTGEVFLWMISCGEGEEIPVTATFTEFLDRIQFHA
jgi:hypothetical protein